MFRRFWCANVRKLSLLMWGALSLSLIISSPNIVTAKELCTDWVGKVVSVEGVVEARRVAHTTWEPTKVGETFCPGDKLRVETWRAAIVLANDTIIRLDQGTTITFTEIENKESSWLELLEGIVHFLSRVPHTLTITTPFVNATVEGTEFVIRVDSNETNVWVLEGTVRVENTLGKLLLEGGEAAVARAGEGPKRQLNVKPRDAVQWALYYPPLLDVSKEAVTRPNQGIYQQALSHYQAGEIQQALDQLNTIPLEQRDPQFWGTRAGLLLAVGQIDKANLDIEEALRQEPNNGTALALQSVVALVNNNKDDALQLATQSVTNAPESSVGHVALSYAQQAHFDIDQALVSAQRATTHSPDDALAWARVAELQLSLGNLSDARESAQKAVALNPRLARTQTILGFALLTEAKIMEARASFEKAIVLDQAAPLPRLGVGLTKIQKSELAEGRRDIEIAASLDPSNAIIRSYLGKAYYEEKRDPGLSYPMNFQKYIEDQKKSIVGNQFEMAKALDPQDPTPYFYDAIRKQTLNRPIEALADYQKAIDLNDNRAVYRSRLFLDDDQAARSASLGRLYKDLGFQQRALVEGWKSLTNNPSNHSAHRLLADTYSYLHRHEVARVSELLQSQLLQPSNINNLQPQLSELGLRILDGAGPSALSFNEFNPLFFRNRVALLSNVVVGNRNTLGDDVVLSGMLADPFSLSLGQFHFETDGFRENNDQEHDIFNVLAQGQIVPQLNIQMEYRRRVTDTGDLNNNFDPSDFNKNTRRHIESNTVRFGGRLSPTPNMDVILSLIYAKQKDSTNASTTMPTFFTRGEFETYQGEGQIISRNDFFNVTLGGNWNTTAREETLLVGPAMVPFPPFLIPGFTEVTQPDHNHQSAYVYLNTSGLKNIVFTGGLSWDNLDDESRRLKMDRISPKVGIQVDLTKWARVRMAYFQTVKGSLIVEQTIEPTQVAGFNQFFSEVPNTQAERLGFALDTHLGNTLYSGIEVSGRELKFPTLQTTAGQTSTVFTRNRERLYRAYIYWIPHDQIVVSSEFRWELMKRDAETGPAFTISNRPTSINTKSIPLKIRFFHLSGLFGGVQGTFVWQKIGKSPTSTFSQNKENFFLVDASIGFRFPKRRGIFSLEVKNIFDKNFLFQELVGPFALAPTNPLYIPDRTVIAKLTIALD